jgi:quercetin dioxygenase-like cupin family protein
MEIKRNGKRGVNKGPADYFTGNVKVEPLGQTLIVASGLGWAQTEGGPVEEIRPGDVVWFAPGEKHWHGASAANGMSHIAIQEALDGKAVDWLEQVSDAQYKK